MTVLTGQRVTADMLNGLIPGQPPMCIVQASVAPTVVTGGAVIPWNTDVLDPLDWHSTSVNTTRVTPTIHGIYQCIVNVQWGGNTTGRRASAVRFNGSTLRYGDVKAATTASNVGTLQVAQLELNGTSDYVEAYGFQDSGSTLTIGDTTSSMFSVKLVYDMS